jgi:hypothetical protein
LYKKYLVCILKLMGFKLLIAVLVLALSGANSDLASMCAAYCMSSAPHHHMESQPGPSISHHFHSHHHAANCAECPPESANSLNHKADCASLVQIDALKEGSFSLDAPSKVAQFYVAGTSAKGPSLAIDGERSSVFCASHTLRSSNPASVPLRI